MFTTVENVFFFTGLGLTILGFICAMIGLSHHSDGLAAIGFGIFVTGSILARVPRSWNSLKD